MVIERVNVTKSNMVVGVSSSGMKDADGYYLATVEVDHVANEQGFGYFVRLQDLGSRDVSHAEAKSIAAQLHGEWLRTQNN